MASSAGELTKSAPRLVTASASAPALTRRPTKKADAIDASRASRVVAWDERGYIGAPSSLTTSGGAFGNAFVPRNPTIPAVCPVACYQTYETFSTLSKSGGRFGNAFVPRNPTIPAVCPVASYQSMISTLSGAGGCRISETPRPCVEPSKSPWANGPRLPAPDPRPWRIPVQPWREGCFKRSASIPASSSAGGMRFTTSSPAPAHRPAPQNAPARRPAPKLGGHVGGTPATAEASLAPQRQQEQQEQQEPQKQRPPPPPPPPQKPPQTKQTLRQQPQLSKIEREQQQKKIAERRKRAEAFALLASKGFILVEPCDLGRWR